MRKEIGEEPCWQGLALKVTLRKTKGACKMVLARIDAAVNLHLENLYCIPASPAFIFLLNGVSIVGGMRGIICR